MTVITTVASLFQRGGQGDSPALMPQRPQNILKCFIKRQFYSKHSLPAVARPRHLSHSCGLGTCIFLTPLPF